MDTMIRFRGWLTRAALAGSAVIALVAVLGFPTDTDAPLTPEEIEKNRKYYAEAYQRESPGAAKETAAPSDYETRYLRIATEAARDAGIDRMVARFAAAHLKPGAAVLEVGSGRGYLQDIVENYTGLDISSNVSRFYHKKFVQGSATAMPFADGVFDGGWTIWVLEHVPNPEQALSEMRRVMKNNAVLFLFPAWSCQGWAAEGYRVRPYSDFDWQGKLLKASLLVRDRSAYQAAERIPARTARLLASWFAAPARLHYRRLTPNHQTYWEADSDAINGIDRHETMLWFRTRGDECLNCEGLAGTPLMKSTPLIIRVRK